PIPKSRPKLASSTSSSVAWILDHIISGIPSTATNRIPSSVHDTSHTQFIKELSSPPNPPAYGCPFG
ncbi:hypothetical protein K443DRAFT_95727, partial [Laccaria amethystina LaAM-08-1]